MREVTVKVFTIDELSEKAQEKAYEKWLGNEYYIGGRENKETLYAFAKLFPVSIKKWQYDTCGGYVQFCFYEDEIENLSGIRLLKWLYNNIYEEIFPKKHYWSKKSRKKRKSKIIREPSCALTGYYIDEDILEPVYKFLKRPGDTNFYDLLKECFDKWNKACSNDMEYCLSFEYFKEIASINEYEYLECGKIFRYRGASGAK